MASGLRCLRCLMFMPSGPVELLFVLFDMANCTYVMVSHIVNCLLKAFGLSMSVMAVFSCKVNALLQLGKLFFIG